MNVPSNSDTFFRSSILSTVCTTITPIGKSPGQRGVGNAELVDLDHGTHDVAGECIPRGTDHYDALHVC